MKSLSLGYRLLYLLLNSHLLLRRSVFQTHSTKPSAVNYLDIPREPSSSDWKELVHFIVVELKGLFSSSFDTWRIQSEIILLQH